MRKAGGAEEPKSWQNIMRWPAFLLANAALLLLIGVSTVRETYRTWSVDREIHTLEAQAAALEGNKLQLEVLAKDLVSPDRIEYEARARLDRKKPGERVIVLEGVSTSGTWSGDTSASQRVAVQSIQTTPVTNPQRWWAYFFSHPVKTL